MFTKTLIKPFENDPNSYEAHQRLYKKALELAREELDMTDAQAETFAAWASTLAGWSEPHPLHPPVRIAGLNRAFARAAWGPDRDEMEKITDPRVREAVRKVRLAEAEGYVPRLKDFFSVEGRYEEGFAVVASLIKKLIPA